MPSQPPLPAPTGRLLAHPGFRRLLAAHTVSRSGDAFNTVALAILVFRLSGSGFGVAGVAVAEIAPVLLLGPLAGAVVDRLPRRRVMVAADLWRAALAALLPLVAHRLPAVYAVAFGLSAGSVFFGPASASLLPALVEPRRLVAANGALWSAAVASQIALAPLAGLLVARLGPAPAFRLNAASFLVSAVLLKGLPAGATLHAGPEAGEAAQPRRRWAAEVRDGLSLLARRPLLRLLAVTQLLAALSAGATSALLVVLAQRHLGVGAEGFGLLLAAIGVGAVTGPLILARASVGTRPAGVFGPYLLRGVVDLALATSRSVPAALVALVAYGVGTSTGMVTFTSLLQTEVPPELRGRAFAAFDVLWQAGRLASLAVGGAAADVFGIDTVYFLGGLLLLVAGGLGLARRRRLPPAPEAPAPPGER